MIQEISVTLRKQTASEGCWLWKDQPNDMPRYFTDFVYLGKNEPEWTECANDEKERYELEWAVSHEPVYAENNEINA